MVCHGTKHGSKSGAARKRDSSERDGNQVCALVGPDLVAGVAGFGDSVHDALRELGDNLVQEGVWIEVTNRTDWDVSEKS